MGDVGIVIAMDDMLRRTNEILKRNLTEKEVLIIKEIQAHLEEIKKSADGGWY